MISWFKKKIKSKSGVNKIHAVSFPKSGRTWLQLMMAKIYSDLCERDINDVLNDSNPHYRNLKTGEFMPHLFFSHGWHNGRIGQGNYFPEAYYKKSKVFLLVMDPRDTVISHYYHSRWRDEDFEGTVSDFLRYPYHGKEPDTRQARFGIGPIINYMNAWITNRKLLSDIYIAYYEDFKDDVTCQLTLLCNYVGIAVDNAVIDTAVDYGSFENMRKLEEEETLDWHGMAKSKTGKGSKVRKGKIGGFKEELDQEDNLFLNNEINKKLNPFYERYIY